MKKVTANNLMIGDWVEYKGSKRNVFNTHLYNDNSSEMWLEVDDKQLMVKSATPIPITYDWLMYNNFEDSCTGMYERLFNGFKVKLAFISGTISISISKDGSNALVIHNQQYIHQLQQAYRLATGKELKIKF